MSTASAEQQGNGAGSTVSTSDKGDREAADFVARSLKIPLKSLKISQDPTDPSSPHTPDKGDVQTSRLITVSRRNTLGGAP
jgi:hypothetical protein